MSGDLASEDRLTWAPMPVVDHDRGLAALFAKALLAALGNPETEKQAFLGLDRFTRHVSHTDLIEAIHDHYQSLGFCEALQT